MEILAKEFIFKELLEMKVFSEAPVLA
jgi:hypothetical protein